MTISTDPEQCQVLLDILWKQSVTGLALVDQSGKFLRINPAFCRLTEYTEYELQQKHLHEITDPSDVEAQIAMSKLICSGDIETYDMTKSYITKTKEFLPVLLRVTGLKMNDKLIYFVAEIAPLEKAPLGLPVNPQREKRINRLRYLQFIKDYWIQITTIVGLGIAVLDRFLDHIYPPK